MAIVNGETTSAAAVGFSSLPVSRQIGLLVGLAASIAIGVATVFWAIEPNYQPLYSQLSSRDTGEVIDFLTQSGIQYKVDKRNGTILVVTSQAQDAKIKLAAQGLPKNSGSGFDFLNKTSTLGSSQHTELARHRYALEKELGRTIANFRHVKKARVHLAMPKRSVFIRNQTKVSASVFVDLYSGYHLESAEVASIVHLVASSVPRLSSKNVTVVDEHGRLLTGGNASDGMAMANRLLAYRNQVENSYVQKIQDILSPVLGEGSVKARVSADIDFTSSEQTQERYNPDLPALRSEQTMEEKHLGGNKTQGVPGALSNQPPEQAQAQTKDENSESKPEENIRNRRQHIVRNYELDKTISHTRVQPGRIRRLTVAVIVDDFKSYDKETKEVTSTSLTEKELEQIKALIKDAIGFNAQRGDSLNIINRSFAKPEPLEKLPEMSFWQQDWFSHLIKQILGGGLVIIIIFGVLLPTLRNLANRPVVGNGGGGGDNANNAGDTSTGTAGQDLHLPGPLQTYEDRMQVVQDMANKDPKRVAQVVKTWVDGS